MIMKLRDWQNTIKDAKNLIFCASEYRFSSDYYVPYTIGFSTKIVDYLANGGNLKDIQTGTHNKTVLFKVSPTTDLYRRPNAKNRISIIETLFKNNIFNEPTIFDSREYMDVNMIKDYFEGLPYYKFTISPEGNTKDCHRHYESIVAGTIPVIEYSDEINQKYHGCPILWTDDYSEINEEYLLTKYEEMIDKEFDFSKVFLYNYSLEHQKEIIDHSNYWVGDGRIGKSFYE